MLQKFIDKVSLFIKRFNDPLNADSMDVEAYLFKRGITDSLNKDGVSEANKSVLQKYSDELSFEKDNDYIFHIFRVCYSNEKLYNIKDTLSYIRSCDLEGLDLFFTKIGIKDFVSRKTNQKWHYDYNPVYFIDYFNKPDSTIIKVNGKGFRVSPLDSIFRIGTMLSRVTISDDDTVLRELPSSISNSTSSNAFLVFVSKKWKSLPIKISILKDEIRRIDMDINNSNKIKIEGNGDIVELLRSDKIKDASTSDKDIETLRHDKKIIEIEVLILENILKNEKSSITRN